MEKLKEKIWIPIVVFFESMSRLLAYIPIIWKIRDWDYAYSLDLFRFSLSRLKKSIKNGYHADTEGLIRKIEIAEGLLKRITKNDYCKYEIKKHYEKWGYPELTRKKINSELSYGIFSHKNVNNKEDQEKERKEFKRIMDKQDYLKKYDKHFLFKLLEKHIETWWD